MGVTASFFAIVCVSCAGRWHRMQYPTPFQTSSPCHHKSCLNWFSVSIKLAIRGCNLLSPVLNSSLHDTAAHWQSHKCDLILTKCWRNINHLFAYLLTYLFALAFETLLRSLGHPQRIGLPIMDRSQCTLSSISLSVPR